MKGQKKYYKKITFTIITLLIGMAIFPNIIQTSADQLKNTKNEIISLNQEVSTPKILKEDGFVKIDIAESNSYIINQGGPKLPIISKTFELSDAAAAHRLMESSAHIGKIVLKIERRSS